MSTTLFRWPVRVYYEDTDAGGVVYYACYLAFYERARTEMLRHHAVSQQKLLDERVAFVVRNLSVEYIAPARLDDLLEVCTQVITTTGTSLLFEQQIINADNQILNKAQVKVVCVDPVLMKPRRVPNFILPE